MAVPGIVALHCITAIARRARYLSQLLASLTGPGRQAVAQARHLTGSGKAVCNF